MNVNSNLLVLEPWKENLLRILLMALPFSFALDFKGETGGSLAQILMLLAALSVAGSIVLLGRPMLTRPAKRLLFCSVYVFVLGYLVALLNKVPFENALKISLPYLLFIVGLYSASVAANLMRRAWALFQALILAGMVSLAFRYYHSTSVQEIELDEMRYQILSPALCALLAYVCATFCFMRKIYWPVWVVALGASTVIVLSVTRAYVITFAFVCVGVLLLLVKLGWRNPLHRSFGVWRALGLGILSIGCISGALLSYWLRPDIIESWSSRLITNRVVTYAGDDVNYITRVAEAKGIWDTVSEDASGIFCGMGFGHIYQWAYEYVGEVGSVSSDMVYAFWAPTWFPGHSPFTYALLFGGIPALLWQFYVFAGPLLNGWGLLAVLRMTNNTALLRLLSFALLSIFFYLSQSFTSNPFAERLSGLYLGIVIGLVLSGTKLLAAPDLKDFQGVR